MKLVTWNINSVRLRMPLLAKLAAEQNPDIICLQETKTPDEHFPLSEVNNLGYPYTFFIGEKGYNGVAIISRIPLHAPTTLSVANSPDKRHIQASLPDGTELHNFYVPAGGDEPDVILNPKYLFKLDFVDWMHDFFLKNRKSSDRTILVGDLNIAPNEHDVWSHKQLLNVISHTPPETSRMETLMAGLNWIDVGRHFVPKHEKLYSWWSYRNRDWKKSNRGRRLNHIWTTTPLKDSLASYEVLSHARDWE